MDSSREILYELRRQRRQRSGIALLEIGAALGLCLVFLPLLFALGLATGLYHPPAPPSAAVAQVYRQRRSQ